MTQQVSRGRVKACGADRCRGPVPAERHTVSSWFVKSRRSGVPGGSTLPSCLCPSGWAWSPPGSSSPSPPGRGPSTPWPTRSRPGGRARCGASSGNRSRC
ncbi:hypothetical protein N864_04935 [Intrasporangium chromatireducens Q5-1]|uniref:Uncharacterized protein n=1 Tax=Intrasporangium chromatireducens Q5-1 TaxID=584657 RepID=W9GJR6_9MICO|nr:hypothetical protein N864_04935 [Intrasporangium chromatireducens Q5-1]